VHLCSDLQIRIFAIVRLQPKDLLGHLSDLLVESLHKKKRKIEFPIDKLKVNWERNFFSTKTENCKQHEVNNTKSTTRSPSIFCEFFRRKKKIAGDYTDLLLRDRRDPVRGDT